MIELPKRGMRVHFRPPENAYSARSLQRLVSGQSGVLEGLNSLQARVRFLIDGRSVIVNVNEGYLYAEDSAHTPSSIHALFRK